MANPTQLFRRNATWRKGVMRTLVTDVILHGKVETTETRAKELRRHVDKMITRAKKGTLHSRRKAESLLRPVAIKNGKSVPTSTKDSISIGKYLFDTIAPKYKDRKGGYTRIIKAPTRRGDNTPMAIIELV